MNTPQTVIDFWRSAGPKRWFAKDDAFDATFRDEDRGLTVEEAARAVAL